MVAKKKSKPETKSAPRAKTSITTKSKSLIKAKTSSPFRVKNSTKAKKISSKTSKAKVPAKTTSKNLANADAKVPVIKTLRPREIAKTQKIQTAEGWKRSMEKLHGLPKKRPSA